MSEPVMDEDLWFASNCDPVMYVAMLRERGDVGPPQTFAPVLRPQAPTTQAPTL